MGVAYANVAVLALVAVGIAWLFNGGVRVRLRWPSVADLMMAVVDDDADDSSGSEGEEDEERHTLAAAPVVDERGTDERGNERIEEG